MLTLRYHSDTTIPVEAELIRPDQLSSKSVAEIERLPLQHGNRSVPLAEFFRASGDPADGQILIQGDCSRVKLIGAGMTGGRILIEGDAGMHLGSEMEGGLIEVRGQVGDWLGAEMHGGRIHVQGNAGHLVGAGYRGSRFGMTGGVILVEGNAENEIGSNMRRGFIAVGGDAGDFAAVSMIAGTVFVFGKPGIRPAAGMKRGTAAFFDSASPPSLLPSFRYDCEYCPAWLSVYLKQLEAWGFPAPPNAGRSRWRRFSGDLVALGKGEVLLRLENAP